MTQNVLAQPQNGAGETTLQGAYDNDPTGAQILLNAVPDPITIQAAVAGAVFDVIDVGGQSIFQIDADPDTIVARAGITVENSFTNSGAFNAMVFDDTFTTGGGYNGGSINSSGTITYDNGFFIWGLLVEQKRYVAAAAPGFAAFTLFNALPVITTAANFDLVQALVLNAGVTHERTSAGTSNSTGTTGLSFSSGQRATVSGAIVSYTSGLTAVRCAPVFSSVFGSGLALGTIRGLHCINPAPGLFQPSAGFEGMTAYVGVEVDAIPFGGNVTKRALRSAITAAGNALMIDNTGGAESDFKNGNLHFNDNRGVKYGNSGANPDLQTQWVGISNEYEYNWLQFGQAIRWSRQASLRWQLQPSTVAASEMGFNFEKYAFGLSTAFAIGNAVGVFGTKTRTTSDPGDYTDFYLFQNGALTINDAINNLSTWRCAMTPVVIGTGSLTNAYGVNVEGAITAGSVNNVALIISSNPSGGSGVNAALWVTAGLAQFDGRTRLGGDVQYPPTSPGALAAGNTNNYAGTANHWNRLQGNAAGTSTLTGIVAASDGDSRELTNVSANNITLGHQDTGSTAANRIISPSGVDYILGPDESCAIRYDGTTARWRILYGSGA